MLLNVQDKEQYMHYLYEQGLLELLLDLAIEEMELYLHHNSYRKALDFYEIILTTTYHLGRLSHLTKHLHEFQKVCNLYGTMHHKMQYYRYLTYCYEFEHNDAMAIKSAKQALLYAAQTNQSDFIALCYSSLSALYSKTGDRKQSDFALKLTLHHIKNVSPPTLMQLEMNCNLLQAYSNTQQVNAFFLLKHTTLQFIANRPFHFCIAKLYISEAMLLLSLKQFDNSLASFKHGMTILKQYNNLFYIRFLLQSLLNSPQAKLFPLDYLENELKMIEYYLTKVSLQHLQLPDAFLENLDELIKKNDALKDSLPLVALKELQQQTNAILQQQSAIVVICFAVTATKEKGTAMNSQFPFAVLHIILELLKNEEVLCCFESSHEGILVVKDSIVLDQLFYKIHQHVSKLTVKNKVNAQIHPVHFGISYSSSFQQATFEQLYTKAQAALYYAQAHNKLYLI